MPKQPTSRPPVKAVTRTTPTKSLKKRSPSQDRSKERLEKILKAAEECILRNGAANLKVLDIAREADMPPASIYQYFKNREQIVEALLMRYLDLFYQQTVKVLDNVSSEDELIQFLEEGVYAYSDFFKSSPAFQAIWWGSGGWDELRKIEQYDNDRLARTVVQRIESFQPGIDPHLAYCACLTIVETASSVTCSSVKIGGKVERTMLDEMITMITTYLKNFIEMNSVKSSKARLRQ